MSELAHQNGVAAEAARALAYETDASGAWCWVVWAISETRAQLAAICSTEAEAKRQIENVPHIYPDCWAMHERAPVNHSFGAADLKSLHWRSALSGVRRRRP
jgi:hypothetical protein